MAKNGIPPPGGGPRVTAAEKQRRLDFADRLLRAGTSRADVVARMHSRFGISSRAADRYIARVRERWEEESRGSREIERAAAVARLDRLSHKAEQRGAFAAAVSAEKLRCQISGLFAPFEVATTLSLPEAEDITEAQMLHELAAIEQLLKSARVRGELGSASEGDGPRETPRTRPHH